MQDSSQESSQSSPRSRASLNIDVLDSIFAVTNYPDLLSLSLTCSVFRPLAVRAILRTYPVVLKKIASIPKFHDFIFSDAAARTPHIIALVVDVAYDEDFPDPETYERAVEALVAILGQSSSLKSLELLSSANGRPLAYLGDPRLSAAVGEVISLRDLTIGGTTKATDFIGAVRSPITKLTLRFLEPAGDLGEWSPTSLDAALSRFAHSLESLAIEYSDLRLASDPPGSPMPVFTQLHALRSVTFNYLIAVPHLPLLMELFPNLDGTVHLTESTYSCYDVPHLEGQHGSQRYDFFRRAREQNGMAQERRCWTRLERLICDVATFFILNLRCPIGLIMIEACPTDAHSLDCERRYLMESLRDHPPARLNLHVTTAARWQFDGFNEPSIEGTIPPEAATTLTHLTLFVEYLYDARPRPTARYTPPSPAETRWDDLWHDTLLPSIQHLHALTHFRLVFHCFTREAEYPDPERPISEEPLVRNLRPSSGFDFNAAASAIADALPSLQFFFITNSASVFEPKLEIYAYTPVERWCESRAWRIVPHALAFGENGISHPKGAAPQTDTLGTRKELVELKDDVAEAIIEIEDLDLSMKEKEVLRRDYC